MKFLNHMKLKNQRVISFLSGFIRSWHFVYFFIAVSPILQSSSSLSSSHRHTLSYTYPQANYTTLDRIGSVVELTPTAFSFTHKFHVVLQRSSAHGSYRGTRWRLHLNMSFPGTMAEVNQFLKASTKNDVILVLTFLWTKQVTWSHQTSERSGK